MPWPRTRRRRIGLGRRRRRRAAGRRDQIPRVRRTRRAGDRHQRPESGRRLHCQAVCRSRFENQAVRRYPPSSGSASPPEPAWARRTNWNSSDPRIDGESTEAVKLDCRQGIHAAGHRRIGQIRPAAGLCRLRHHGQKRRLRRLCRRRRQGQGRHRLASRARARQSAQRVQRPEAVGVFGVSPQGLECLRTRRPGGDLRGRQIRSPQIGRPVAFALASRGRRTRRGQHQIQGARRSPTTISGGSSKNASTNWPTRSKPTAKSCATPTIRCWRSTGPV